MIKLLSGYCPGYKQAFELTGSDVAYNWDWPGKISLPLPDDAIWPMIINNETSIERFRWWSTSHLFDHVLWHNEPPIRNPGAAVALAEWTNAKRHELIAGGYMRDSDVCIVGNFLIMPGNYSDYAAEIAWFMGALDFDAILGVHLYHNHAEDPAIAAGWQYEQMFDIRQDYDAFAVTEWGDLSSLWRAGEGPDIPAYSQYMRQCWEEQREVHCYASSWYVGCASSAGFKNADYVLTNQDGTLRPLGEVWRDLPTGDTVPTDPPPKEGHWETVYTLPGVWRGQEWRDA